MAGEKRNQDQEQDTQRKETIVIVDIEGTTTSISFVKETLFPYVRENLKDYLEKKWDDAEFKDDIAKLKEQAEKDATDKIEGLVSITGETPEETKESLMKNILWQMDNDRKSGALKQLQGHMWRDAYKSGAVKGHVYEDVPKALEDWTKNGRKVYVYSSGSVEAQKLLFSHSEHGDLLKYFSGYFDTEVGPKQEAASYKNILTKVECDDASKVLFLTDVAKEAKAAVEAGMASVVVTREGNEALTEEEKTTYSTIKSFLDLAFQTSAKRQKIDTETDEEPKKTEEPPVKASEPAEAAVEDVEMKDVSEKEVEKKAEVKSTVVEEEKSKSVEKVAPVKPTETPKEAMECETTTAAAVEPEKSSTETEKVVEDKITKKVEEKITKKVEEKTTKETEETVAEASTSEADKPETEAKKSDTPVEDKDKDKQIEQSKSEPTTNLTENKTEQAEKVVDAPIAETKMETEVDNKPETAVVEDKTTKEPPKTEETPKVEEKPEEVKEPAAASKTETKETEDKSAVEEVKQNGDSKPEKAESITTNGTTTEVKTNGDSKETTVATETKEPEKAVVDTAKSENVEPEPVKSESVKEEEKTKEDVVEKKLNGSTPTTEKVETTETTHTNGVNEDTKQNGGDESPADKESIKVKKVVDTIAADGAGEPEVVAPVAVVAATS